MYAHPGRKWLFMGAELGQVREWNHDTALDWSLLDSPEHAGIQRLVRELNRLYRSLHARDDGPEGFAWLDVHDQAHSIYSWVRRGHTREEQVVVICNLTPLVRHGYRVGVSRAAHWQELLNTDASYFGGSGAAGGADGGGCRAEEQPAPGQPCSLLLTLPPLGVLWLAPGSAA